MNRRTAGFRAMYAALPAPIRAQAVSAFQAFLRDPHHPGLRPHPLKATKKGQHLPGSVSVAVTIKYRAIYVGSAGVNVWYWIGSHADDDAYIGRI